MKSGRILVILGMGLFGLSGMLFLTFDPILESILDWQIQLHDGNLLTSIWREPPFPVRLKCYVFEILNGKDFQDGRAVARVREHGPFVFTYRRLRKIEEWGPDETYVKVMESMNFEFEEDASVHGLDRTIRAVNAPLFLIMGFVSSKVKELHLNLFAPIVKNVLYQLFKYYEEALIQTQTIEDILVGREIGLLQLVDGIMAPLKSVGLEIPLAVGIYQLGKVFGFIELRHNKTFGPLEFYTGQNRQGKFNHIRRYNNKFKLDLFRGPCNDLRGGDGTLWGSKPPSKPGSGMWLFNPHLCRPIEFQYERNSTLMNIVTYRYRNDPNLFSIRNNSNNWCFCPKEETRQRCEGVFFMKKCLGGSPMAMTYPHFYGSAQLQKRVRGLEPDYEKHVGFLEVDRVMGSTVQIGVRAQLNLDMQQSSDLRALSRFPSTIMPYIWFEEGALLEGWVKGMMVFNSNAIENINAVFAVMGATGLFMVLVGAVRSTKNKTANKQQQQQKEEEEQQQQQPKRRKATNK